MPTISLSGPDELLTILPFHLGFRPERSVVVVCFHGVRLGLVARIDLVGPGDAARAAAETVPALVQQRPSRVVLVGFADESDAQDVVDASGAVVDPAPLLDALRERLADEGVPVGDRLVVRDGRWFGLDCDCCPPPGRLMPAPAEVPAVAEYVSMGTAVLGSRAQLARLVEPLPPDHPHHDARLEAVEQWVRRFEQADSGDTVAARRARRRLVDDALGAWVRLVRQGLDADPSPRTVAALVAPLVDTHFRDLVVAWLCPGFPADHVPGALADRLRRALATHGHPGTDADTDAGTERLVLARVEQLCRATPEACGAHLLAATAAYAWWLGDGAHASFAVERALRADPRHGLATLVRAALEHGVRPPRVADAGA